MPAMITHYLFAKRVLSRLKKQGVETADYPMAMIGAQGPDVFFLPPGAAVGVREKLCT